MAIKEGFYDDLPHSVFYRGWRFVVENYVIVAGLIAGLWIALTWFEAEISKRQTDSEIAIRDSQKPFLERQLTFYFETAKVTSKLATLTPSKPVIDNQDRTVVEDWSWARRRFWELYWGELAAVESPEVANAMVDFGNDLKKLEDCVDRGETCDKPQEPLTLAAIRLAHQIRGSIAKGWGYSLPPIASK
jgi:hypothetical protein